MTDLNKKDKIQLAVTAVLIIVFVALLFGPKKKNAPAVKPKTYGSGGAVQVTPVKLDNILYQKLLKQAEAVSTGRDPFTLQPVVYNEETPEGWALMGIAWDPESPTAIINNKIVVVGSQVGDRTVVYIGRDRVVLSDGKENYELFLEL